MIWYIVSGLLGSFVTYRFLTLIERMTAQHELVYAYDNNLIDERESETDYELETLEYILMRWGDE